MGDIHTRTDLSFDYPTARTRHARRGGHVDILPPNRLTPLWTRKLSANVAAATQASGGVDISWRHRLLALWISTVSVALRMSGGQIEVWTSGARRDSKPCAVER